jgi:hypothetical protein
MKKLLLTTLVMCLFGWTGFAQVSFLDDFESYTVGDYIGFTSSNWTTWSGTTGGAEDAQITDSDAASGVQSVYFEAGAAGGGPQDVVLPFGDTYEFGLFTFTMNMKIISGTGAYFNFQAVEPIGSVWALEFRFDETGNLDGTGAGGTYFSTEYEHDVWFEVKAEIDLTNNNWKAYIDGELVGEFSNANNSVASLDLFPFNQSNGLSSFFVDDVAFTYEPPVFFALDGAVFNLNMGPQNISGNDATVRGQVRNLGTDVITSFDLTWSDGTNEATDNISGVSLENFDTYDFEHSAPFTIADGANTLTVSISNINGGVDENPDNDSKTANIEGIVPAEGKVVVGEEATGTWCPWCPRGEVFMNFMEDNFGDYWEGVAVHNEDPMMVNEYDDGLTGLPGFTGFPSVAVNRDDIVDPTQLEGEFFDRITDDPVAVLVNGAEYDEATGELKVSVSATFNEEVQGDYRVNVILTEDGVTGTGSGYAQANAYAGGNNGPMGGYENLPSPVPASMMVYDHVGRALLGGFEGADDSLPESIEGGEVRIVNYTTTLDGDWNAENMHIVSIITLPNGDIDNAASTTIAEAEDNGYIDIAVNTAEVVENASIKISPNPMVADANIFLNILEASPVSMELRNSVGQLVAAQQFGQLQGLQTLPLNASNLSSGIYFVELNVGGQKITEKIVVAK